MYTSSYDVPFQEVDLYDSADLSFLPSFLLLLLLLPLRKKKEKEKVNKLKKRTQNSVIVNNLILT